MLRNSLSTAIKLRSPLSLTSEVDLLMDEMKFLEHNGSSLGVAGVVESPSQSQSQRHASMNNFVNENENVVIKKGI